MTGKREGHPCCGLHVSDEGVGGVGGKTGKREVQGAPPVAGYIQGVGGVGGRTGLLAPACRNRLGRYTGVHLMEMECYIGVGGVGGRTVLPAKQYRKAGGAGDTHVEGHI
ncbi:hypothetical protein B0H14DRAFT_2637149 [Mycena olivaceomarginata]|nr:hypothetical protein B0H14DRAFT_2637149 [Mycena olivaceomarginata]